MAVQLKSDELKDCKSYFDWLVEKIIGIDILESFGISGWVDVKKLNLDRLGIDGKCMDDAFTQKCMEYLGRYSADAPSSLKLLFETDFRVVEKCKADETQAVNGMELRRRYAEDIGKKLGKSDRDIDRIWKTIKGKCSVLELMIHLATRLDEMTNEEEKPGSTTGKFFNIMLRNLGILEAKKEQWNEILSIFLDRKYEADGSGGGLFPLKNWSCEDGSKDQRDVSIWFQMNAWLNENLDEDGYFEEKKE
jgi:hypothetical protein